MASPAKDPLDVLQAMFEEVLVQTGKALRASHKDGSKKLISGGGSALRTKMPETMTAFHYALDDLESEITRAKAVLIRDLEELQVARIPVPTPQPVAPPAPMMEMPSTLAHTMSLTPGFPPPKEETKRAPFPDMGMGLPDDVVVDLTASDKKPVASPLLATNTLNPGASGLGTPPVKESPKPTTPSKVTPVPPPQIPAQLTAIATPTQMPSAPSQAVPATQAPQDNSVDLTTSVQSIGGAPAADMTGGELNFTNMEFTLAPTTDGPSQNAPPAPMQDFDISSFTAQSGGNDLLSMDNFTNPGADAVNTAVPAQVPAPAPAKESENFSTTGTNVDPMYDLGNLGSGGGVDDMDLDLDLGGGSGANDNTFDDLFFDTNDADMGQFDNAYFGLE